MIYSSSELITVAIDLCQLRTNHQQICMQPSNPKPLTPDLSKLVRRQLDLSQRDVIEATGLASYKLKQFEARGLDIKVDDLRALRDFYSRAAEEKGLSFDDIEAQFNASAGTTPTDTQAARGLDRMGFLISAKIAPEAVDQLMADIEASDDCIAEIVKAAVQTSLFGGMSDETDTQLRDLFGHLAANYLRFRCLQGRNIVAPMRDEAQTVGDYLAQWLQTAGVSHVVDQEPATAEQE